MSSDNAVMPSSISVEQVSRPEHFLFRSPPARKLVVDSIILLSSIQPSAHRVRNRTPPFFSETAKRFASIEYVEEVKQRLLDLGERGKERENTAIVRM